MLLFEALVAEGGIGFGVDVLEIFAAGANAEFAFQELVAVEERGFADGVRFLKPAKSYPIGFGWKS